MNPGRGRGSGGRHGDGVADGADEMGAGDGSGRRVVVCCCSCRKRDTVNDDDNDEDKEACHRKSNLSVRALFKYLKNFHFIFQLANNILKTL